MTDMLVEPLSSAQSFTSSTDTRRYFHLRDIEWRDSGSSPDEYTFMGQAAVYNSWSELLWTPRGMFRERFLEGSLTDILRSPQLDCRFLKNHDKNLVLARTRPGTLELEERDGALAVWARVAKTSYATDLKLSMERGDIDQMSIQFELDYDRGAESRWYEDKASGEVRHDVVKVSDLFDVSVVTFPAYAETSAAMRDIERAQKRGMISVPRSLPESTLASDKIETILNDAGFPRDRTIFTGNVSVSEAQMSPRTYQRCRIAIAEQAWAIHPTYLNLIMAILDERSSGNAPSAEEIKERMGVRRDNEPTQAGSVAVIPLMGPVMARAGAMSQMSGAKSLEDFRAEFRQALNDPNISNIVLDIDSPGGTVDGVPEMAAEIKAARDIKPITGVANYMAASAAYWILCACSEAVASPSAEVGSVGVYSAHQDRSAEMEMKGIKTTFIHAGDHKVELNPYEPLSEEAKAHVQEQVDNIYNDFVGAVAENRGVSTEDVLKNFGQGRMKQAPDALKAGMIDRVATMDEVLSGLSDPVQTRDFSAWYVENYNSPTISSTEAGLSLTEVRDRLGFVAQAETDPAGTQIVAPAETDPVGAANPVVALKAASSAYRQRAREERVRLTKEMLK